MKSLFVPLHFAVQSDVDFSVKYQSAHWTYDSKIKGLIRLQVYLLFKAVDLRYWVVWVFFYHLNIYSYCKRKKHPRKIPADSNTTFCSDRERRFLIYRTATTITLLAIYRTLSWESGFNLDYSDLNVQYVGIIVQIVSVEAAIRLCYLTTRSWTYLKSHSLDCLTEKPTVQLRSKLQQIIHRLVKATVRDMGDLIFHVMLHCA